MSDLTCTECGVAATYADANIGNIRRTCEGTRDGRHDWVEPLHSDVDVVAG